VFVCAIVFGGGVGGRGMICCGCRTVGVSEGGAKKIISK
jgi:hypothetical protein